MYMYVYTIYTYIIYAYIITPCSKHHTSVYPIDSTSLRFNGQFIKSVVLVLLLANN